MAQPPSPVAVHAPIDMHPAFDNDNIVQQRVVAQIIRCPKRFRSVEKRGTAHRNQVFNHQQVGLQTGIFPPAIADRGIDCFRGEIDQSQAGRQPDLDVRVALIELVQPWDQPACRKGRQGIDGQRPRSRRGLHPPDRLGHLVEPVPEPRQQDLSRIGQQQAARLAAKQPHPKMCLQCLDLLTDRGRRYRQFVGGLYETQVPGGRFKAAQGIQGG